VRRARLGAATRLYATTIRHARTAPLRYGFEHRSYTWFVDLDALPRLGPLSPLARFEARDHLGAPDASLRANLDTFLAAHDVDLEGGRITMLANARVLGYVFNPISLFWCHGRDGDLECVVVEVHNTYGERHAYFVRTDAQHRASTDKALYVSPFHDVSGYYDLVLPEPDAAAHASVILRRPGQPPFVATLVGTALPATVGTVVRASLARPLEPLAIRARITAHGVRLWLRRLPVQPRPTHPPQEAVQ
jgi:uncharacterized protein